MGTLTVYETLLYSALLRLPRAMSRQAKEKRVRDTMTELGIEHIANSKIGTAGKRGISGGEKRRVSIAMEVVTSPSILYLDEPTSGLDSYNALSVVQALVTLARRYQRTVILTIHQPRSNIFRMFDRLLLLAEGGYMVYSGPIISAPSPVPTAAPLSGAIMNNKGSGVEQQQSTQSLPAQQPILLNWLAELGIQCPTGFNLADYLSK
jgi:ABC-type multidrug transport system ATPase subunit